MIATNIGLKTSNDLAFVSRGRSIKCVLCDLFYASNSIAKRLADGCPCMLVLWHTVSSGSAFCLVQYQRNITVLSGCLCACENVCDIRENGAYACQCSDTFCGAISSPYTCFVSCVLFLNHILTLLLLKYIN